MESTPKDMKKLMFLLPLALGLMWTSCDHKVTPNRQMLKLTLSLQGPSGLEVCLKNIGDQSIKMRVNREQFEGFFQIYAADAIIANAYYEEYRKRLETSLWENPLHILKKNEKISWQVSIPTLAHEVVGNQKQQDVLGDTIIAVCEGLYIQEGKDLERVDLRSNYVRKMYKVEGN